MGHHAQHVQQVQGQSVLDRERHKKRNHEPAEVNPKAHCQEFLGFYELEVNHFSHGIAVVELKVLFVLDVKNVGQVVVVEVHMLVVFLLDGSDLVADNHSLEVDSRVLNFNVLLVGHELASLSIFELLEFAHRTLFCLGKAISVCLDIPSHVWVLLYDFSNDFLLSIVEVLEVFLSVVVDLRGHEWWQVGVVQEVFEVEIPCLHLFLATGQTLLVLFFDLLGLSVVSVQEVVDSVNTRHLELDWELKHENLLVVDTVDVKDLF